MIIKKSDEMIGPSLKNGKMIKLNFCSDEKPLP
jgi:hypothetical protein